MLTLDPSQRIWMLLILITSGLTHYLVMPKVYPSMNPHTSISSCNGNTNRMLHNVTKGRIHITQPCNSTLSSAIWASTCSNAILLALPWMLFHCCSIILALSLLSIPSAGASRYAQNGASASGQGSNMTGGNQNK